MTLLGVSVGNDPKKIIEFENWLGRKVDLVSIFIGDRSWRDFDNGIEWELKTFSYSNRSLIVSIPLMVDGSNLYLACQGVYNNHYKRAAHIIDGSLQDRVIYIRLGWEQNGEWMKWSAVGKELSYIIAFQEMARCFREVSHRFRIIWCPNIGQHNPADSYPGDEYVDIIALDFYHMPQYGEPTDPVAAWNYMVARKYGLQWHLEFARARRKPIAYPEWGVNEDNFGPYIIRMAEWCRSSDVLLQAYWNSNSDYAGTISEGQYPTTAKAFKASFL